MKTVYIIDAPTPSGRASPTTSRSTSRRTAGPSSPVTARRRARPTTAALHDGRQGQEPRGRSTSAASPPTAAPGFLKQAVQAGLDVPFVGPDGIYDGSATTKDSFLNLAGDDAKNAYATAAAVGDFPGRAEFAAKFKAEYGTDPTGYSATGYACAQVVLDALKRAGPTATSVADLREKLRAATVTPRHLYLGDRPVQVRRQRRHEPEDHLFYAYDPADEGLDVQGAARLRQVRPAIRRGRGSTIPGLSVFMGLMTPVVRHADRRGPS